MAKIVKFKVEGLAFLRRDGGDEPPRVRDVDLAERLHYTRPRTIRDLIRRLIKQGKLQGVTMRRAVRRIAKSGARGVAGIEERKIDEFWLTEEQAIYVAMRSDTHKAHLFTIEVIRVFRLALRGVLPVPAPTFAPSDATYIRGKLDFLAENVSKAAFERATVRDNDAFARACSKAISASAAARGESWQRRHGAVRRQFRVASYKDLRLSEVDLLMRWLLESGGGSPAVLFARQLSLFPALVHVGQA